MPPMSSARRSSPRVPTGAAYQPSRSGREFDDLLAEHLPQVARALTAIVVAVELEYPGEASVVHALTSACGGDPVAETVPQHERARGLGSLGDRAAQGGRRAPAAVAVRCC